MRNLGFSSSCLTAALAVRVCCACADAPRSTDADDLRDMDAGGELEAGGALAEDAAALYVPRALVHAALWERVAFDEDPLSGAPPRGCAPDGYGEENLGGELAFFVRTELCAAITVQQASRAAVHAGDRLQIRAYHFPLTAPEQSSAQLIVQIGETRVWERELPIPSPAAELVEEWEADADYPAGTPVLFHVSNHGNNEYDLIGIDILP
jgi:hypothetical protein